MTGFSQKILKTGFFYDKDFKSKIWILFKKKYKKG